MSRPPLTTPPPRPTPPPQPTLLQPPRPCLLLSRINSNSPTTTTSTANPCNTIYNLQPPLPPTPTLHHQRCPPLHLDTQAPITTLLITFNATTTLITKTSPTPNLQRPHHHTLPTLLTTATPSTLQPVTTTRQIAPTYSTARTPLPTQLQHHNRPLPQTPTLYLLAQRHFHFH